MKVKVTKPAWYKQTLLKEGQIVEFTGDKLPSWGEAVKLGKVSGEISSDLTKIINTSHLAKETIPYPVPIVTEEQKARTTLSEQKSSPPAGKVADLSAEEKADLIKRAEAVGIKNIGDSWGLKKLEDKIKAEESSKKPLCCVKDCGKEATHVVDANSLDHYSYACEEHVEDLKEVDRKDQEGFIVITIEEWESR